MTTHMNGEKEVRKIETKTYTQDSVVWQELR